jgi:hypothetical protein
MKRASIILSIGLLLVAVAVTSWFYGHEHAQNEIAKQAQLAAAANSVETAAGGMGNPNAQPATPNAAPATQPLTRAPRQPLAATTPQPAPAGTAAVPAAAVEEEKAPATISEQIDAQTAIELKESVETRFKEKLSFPMTEAKMIAFAEAALKVKKINNKWDVQIASAETDMTAIEYNNFAVEEITKSLQNMPGVTLDEYNEMTKLTATDSEFNNVYQVYKQLVTEGHFKAKAAPVIPAATAAPVVTTPATTATTVQPTAPVPATPAAQPAVGTTPAVSAPATGVVTTKPVVIPANPGTAPAPQGSPAPQYSQPSSR